MQFFRKVKTKLGKTISVPCDKNDPAPVEVSLDLKRPETQDERVRRIIREQIRPQSYGYETEEDNEDLEVEDDENFLGELPMTMEEADYIKSKHSDIIEEVLTPHSSPITEGVEPDPPPATDSGQGAPESTNNSPPLEDGKDSE